MNTFKILLKIGLLLRLPEELIEAYRANAKLYSYLEAELKEPTAKLMLEDAKTQLMDVVQLARRIVGKDG